MWRKAVIKRIKRAINVVVSCKTKMPPNYVTDKRSNKMMKQVNKVDFDPNNGDCIFTVPGHEQMTDTVFIGGKSVDAIIVSGDGVDHGQIQDLLGGCINKAEAIMRGTKCRRSGG